MKKFNVGKMNKRIDIMRTNSTDDGYGGKSALSPTKSSVATMWAKVNFSASDIKTEFGNTQNRVDADFIVRKRAAGVIRATDEVQFKTRFFKINKVYEADLDDFVKINATRIDE